MSIGSEQVLVVPTLLFHELGVFQGFCARTKPYLDHLIDPVHTSYRLRDEVEQDPSYKQLIPYCLFQYEETFFYYQRTSGQGDKRLQGKRSIGVGGHISSIDEEGNGPAYQEGMKREIEEEVYLDDVKSVQLIGLINDDETDVGRVHLGLVHLFELDAPSVKPREESLINTGFATPEELYSDLESFETWSQICLRYLITGEADVDA